jgi:hypothetical protein
MKMVKITDDKIDRIMQPSTLKGIISAVCSLFALIFTLFGKGSFEISYESAPQLFIEIALAFYGAYQILRDEDKAVATSVKAASMKSIAIIFLVCSILFMPMMANAFTVNLRHGPISGATKYDVSINTVITPNVSAQADGSLIYVVENDASPVAAGSYTFQVRAYGSGGWPSDWSDPLIEIKPEMDGPLTLQIIP